MLLAPALYYGFQVSLRDVFVSSYGVIFPALPVMAVLVAHALLQLRHSKRHSKPKTSHLPL